MSTLLDRAGWQVFTTVACLIPASTSSWERLIKSGTLKKEETFGRELSLFLMARTLSVVKYLFGTRISRKVMLWFWKYLVEENFLKLDS